MDDFENEDDFEDENEDEESEEDEPATRKKMAEIRKVKCIPISDLEMALQTAKNMFAVKNRIEDGQTTNVNKIAGGFFLLLHRDYPGKFVWTPDLMKALKLEKIGQAAHFVSRARRRLLEMGRILANEFGVGHKVAEPAEIVDEYIKTHSRACSFLVNLIKRINGIEWNQEMLGAISKEKIALLRVALAFERPAKDFLAQSDTGIREPVVADHVYPEDRVTLRKILETEKPSPGWDSPGQGAS